MSAFDDREQFRQGLAKFNAIYAHEFTREFRRGKTPAVFEDEPIKDTPNLVELFERQIQTGGARKDKQEMNERGPHSDVVRIRK
jgi:hypothetical protein